MFYCMKDVARDWHNWLKTNQGERDAKLRTSERLAQGLIRLEHGLDKRAKSPRLPMHLKFWGEQTGAENERDRRELALSFVAELVYWAYKHDERSLERWTKSSNKSGENVWAYTLMRKAMFGVGGVSRCRFLWTTDAISLTEMRVPHGVLELPRLDSDTREKIRPWIERAGIAVVLREAQPWNGHYRDGGNDRDTDGEDRQRNRPGP